MGVRVKLNINQIKYNYKAHSKTTATEQRDVEKRTNSTKIIANTIDHETNTT